MGQARPSITFRTLLIHPFPTGLRGSAVIQHKARQTCLKAVQLSILSQNPWEAQGKVNDNHKESDFYTHNTGVDPSTSPTTTASWTCNLYPQHGCRSTMTIIQFITDDYSKSDKTPLPKVPRPRQPTPADPKGSFRGSTGRNFAHRSQSSEGATTCS